MGLPGFLTTRTVAFLGAGAALTLFAQRALASPGKTPLEISLVEVGNTEVHTPSNQYAEAAAFLEEVSRFDIKTTTTRLPYIDPGPGECVFLAPWQVPDNKVPLGHVVLLLWENREPEGRCWNGGTWGGDMGINGRPVASVPFSDPYFTQPFQRWDSHGAQVIVFEIMNALTWIVREELNETVPSAENCPEEPDGTFNFKECHANQFTHFTDDIYRGFNELAAWNQGQG